MRSPKLLCAFAAWVLAVSPALAEAKISFPPGVGWDNATPDQIREAVLDAVKKNPDDAVEIVTSSIGNVARTGRFPRAGGADGKQTIDPDVVTFEDVADQIGQAAIQGNPALASQIMQAVSNAVANPAAIPGDGGGGGGDGGDGGGGGGPAVLPGGFGGGGGGGGTSGGGTIYGQ